MLIISAIFISTDLQNIAVCDVIGSPQMFLQCFDTVGWVIWPVKVRHRYDL